MSWIGEMGRGLARLVRRESFARELDEEMRLHREMKERTLTTEGARVDEARYVAARAFGNATALGELGREAWGWRWLEDSLQDCWYGARGLRKSPGYAVTAVITLILGIGATTAIFSVVQTVLLRPLAYADPARIVRVEEDHDGAINFTYATYSDLAATRPRSFERLGAYRPWTFNVSGGAEPIQAEGAMISADLFGVLGVQPEFGRWFREEEQRESASNVVVLSHGLWQREFGGERNVVGRTIRVSDVPHIIVGVMPAGFEFPQGAQIWTPLAVDGAVRSNRRAHLLRVIARLGPGIGGQRANAELQAFARGVDEKNREIDPGLQITAGNLKERTTAPIRPALLVLLGAVGLVLLAACANVANLMLMRNTSRAKEFAVRAALGAGRGRLLRQCLAESGLLGLAGAGGGVLLAIGCVRLIATLGPEDVPRLVEAHVDAAGLAFTAGIALLTAIAFGMAPAAEASRSNANDALREGARGTASAAGMRLKGILVAAEVALALMLLTGGGLLLNSFLRLSRVAAGFDAENVLTANIFLSPNRYGDEHIAPFFDAILERVRAIPGVESAGIVNTLPLSSGAATDFTIDDKPAATADNEPSAYIRVIAGDYFPTMRIRLLRGRWFDSRDTKSGVKVMVINQTMAEKYWPNENPLGKRVTMKDWGPPLTGEVVGVTGDVKSDGLDAPSGNMIYWPERQFPSIFNNIVVRTSREGVALAPLLKAAVWSVDGDLPVASIATMDERLTASVAPRRLQTTLFGVFAVLSVLMAVVGIYGVMAYAVGGRRREIGIRMALGADARTVRNLVVRQGLFWTAMGLGVGLAAALGLSGSLSSLLYGVTPRDPWTVGGVSLMLVTVAYVACYLPARRATRVSPMVALRHE